MKITKSTRKVKTQVNPKVWKQRKAKSSYRFTVREEKQYNLFQNVKGKMESLKEQLDELKMQKELLEEKLKAAFTKGGGQCRTSQGTVVVRKTISIDTSYITQEEVGNVKRTGYSFYRYTERPYE